MLLKFDICLEASAHPKCDVTASASGCSDSRSSAINIGNAPDFPSSQATSVTCGRPSVTVPVLSSNTASTFPAVSRLSASFIRIPFSAPFPMPTIIAVGVARPNAHGHAIMRTVTRASNPWEKPSVLSKANQSMNDSSAIDITTGTKMAAMRSTSFCTGALLPWASCTMRIIWARTVPSPTFCAVNKKLPFRLMVPAYTCAPGCLVTGIGSPLNMLSSTFDSPSETMPSTAIRSPGLTTIVSPMPMRSISTVCCFPLPSKRVTVVGRRPINFFMAVDVCPLARSSSSLPNRIKAMITLDASK